jgi:hypothetical protein
MIQTKRTGAVGPLLFSIFWTFLTNLPVRAFQPRENGSVPLNRVWSHYIPGCSIVSSRIQDHRACRTIRWHTAEPIKLDTDTAQDKVFRWLTDGRNDNERLPLCEKPVNERFATRLSARAGSKACLYNQHNAISSALTGSYPTSEKVAAVIALGEVCE